MMIARKDLVTILPGQNDNYVGGVWAVVDTQGHDALIVRGDYRNDLPLEDEYEVAISVRRLTRLA
jgi:hypothetical protein